MRVQHDPVPRGGVEPLQHDQPVLQPVPGPRGRLGDAAEGVHGQPDAPALREPAAGGGAAPQVAGAGVLREEHVQREDLPDAAADHHYYDNDRE